MALPEVHAVALEAHSAAQTAAEVLGRLSAALGTSSQLMGAWLQERNALYTRQGQLEQQLAVSQQQAADKKEQMTTQQLRITQLEAQVLELNSALHALRADQQMAQSVLDSEREGLQRRWEELENQCGILNLQRIPPLQHQHQHQQPYPEQREHQQHQRCNVIVTPMRAIRAEQVPVKTPHGSEKTHQVEGRQIGLDGIGPYTSHSRSDSDVSLPPSQPRTCFVDRVPETLLVGYRLEDLFLDAAGGGETSPGGVTVAGVSTEAAVDGVTKAAAAATGRATSGADAGCGQVIPARLPCGTSATGPSAAQGQAQAPDQGAPPNPDGPTAQAEATATAAREAIAAAAAAAREVAAEAAVAWASREQELMGDHAAQLEAVWAENKALQMDLQNALTYRRISQQLRDQNQALQQQLHNVRNQLEDLKHQLCKAKTAAAVVSATGVQSPHRTVVTAAVAAVVASPPGPRGCTTAALNPETAHAAGEQAGASARAAARAVSDGDPTAAAVPDPHGSSDMHNDATELAAQYAVLISERDKYREKYRDAKQACREARQLARHWQSAYWGLMAAQEGVDAVHDNEIQQLQTSRPAGDRGDGDGTPGGVAHPGPAQIVPQPQPPPQGPATGNGLGKQGVGGGGAGPYYCSSGGIHDDNDGCGVSSSVATRPGNKSAMVCQRLAADGEELRRLPLPALLQKANTNTAFAPAARTSDEEVAVRLAAPKDRPTEVLRCRALREDPQRGREGETAATVAGTPTGDVQRVGAGERGDAAVTGGGDGGADDHGDGEEVADMTQEPSEGEEHQRGPVAVTGEAVEEGYGDEFNAYDAGGGDADLPQQPRYDEATPHTGPGQLLVALQPQPQTRIQLQPTQKYRSRSPCGNSEVQAHGIRNVEQARGHRREEEAAQQQKPEPQQVQDQRRQRLELAADCGSDLPSVHPVGTRGAPHSLLRGRGAVSGGEAPTGAGNNGGGGGWLNKRRSRSWESADTNGSDGAHGCVAAAASGRRGSMQGQQPLADLSRISGEMVPGRRYVQQQLPFKQSSKGSTVPKHKMQQQENLHRPRLQPSQPWHQGPDNEDPQINFQTGPMAARNALDDNVCEGEARSGPGGVAEESDTDCKIVCGGDVDCPMRPPPQKRKVLGGAYAKAAAAVAITVRAATGNAAAPKGIEPGGSLTLPSGAVARHPSSASSHPSALPRPLPSEEGLSALKGNAASRSRYWDETAAAAPAPSPGMNDSNAGAANGVAGGGGGSGSGSGRDGPGYKYSTVIRGRAERDGLQAVECAGCRAFYEAVATWGGVVEPCCTHTRQQQQQQHHQTTVVNAAGAAAAPVPAANYAVAAGGEGQVGLPGAPSGSRALASALRQTGGRHRFKFAPPATPEGFWDIGFGDTQK